MTHFSREPYEASPEEEAEREADIDSHDHEWPAVHNYFVSQKPQAEYWPEEIFAATLTAAERAELEAADHRRAVEAEIDREMAVEREADAFETMLRVLSRPNRCPW
jgi:hypothetical protein